MDAPDGRTWTVRRRIAWPRWRFPSGAWPPLELDPTGILALILLPLVIAILLVFVFSVVALIVELVVVAAAAFFWRGRWIIEATAEGASQEMKTYEARGWRASRKKFEEVSSELAARSDP